MKKNSQIYKVVFIILFMLGCSGESIVEDIPENILIKSMVVYGGNITDGGSSQLSVGVIPNNATNKEVTWSVSNASIAMVSDAGILTAISNGEVVIKAVAKDGSGTSVEKTLTISGISGPKVFVESITINGNNITDGSSLQLTTEVLPEEASDESVTWSVSDALIADISNTGILTPKLNGTVTVSAVAVDGSNVSGELVVNISGVVPVYETILKAENILLWQRSNGGWPKEPYNDFSGFEREQTASEISSAQNSKNNTDTTIDNNHTVGELRYLLTAYKSTNNPDYLEAVIRAIDYLFEAQYNNGGWPQYYPLKTNYSRHITYNDNAMGNVINLMWDITKGSNNTDLLDASYIDKAKAAWNKGIDVILQTQATVNGKKAAWCAQHDEVTLLPIKARSYELASISGSESVGVVRILMKVENPSTEIIQAIKDAVAWFEEVKIVGYKLIDVTGSQYEGGYDRVLVESAGNVMWGRFYDLNTNLPFFCSRDGIKKSTIAEISHERRNGYSWYGNWPKNLIGSEYTSWKNKNGL